LTAHLVDAKMTSYYVKTEFAVSDQIHALYEELILLDEIAGELDTDSNSRIDRRRKELVAQIQQLEKAVDRSFS